MRISDWSSDVCSSDLQRQPGVRRELPQLAQDPIAGKTAADDNDVGRNRLRHRSEKDGAVGHAQRRLVADDFAPDKLVTALDGAPDVPAFGRARLVTPVVAAAELDIDIAQHLIVACCISLRPPYLRAHTDVTTGRALPL